MTIEDAMHNLQKELGELETNTSSNEEVEDRKETLRLAVMALNKWLTETE